MDQEKKEVKKKRVKRGKVILEDITPNEDQVDRTEEEKRDSGSEVALKEVGIRQEINNAIANVPRIFKIADKQVEVKSKPIGKMIQIEDKMYEFLSLLVQSEKLAEEYVDSDVAEQIKKKREIERRLYELSIDIVFLIVNEDWDNPEITKEWLWDNLDVMGEYSTARRIMDAFREMGSPLPFFQSIIECRRF